MNPMRSRPFRTVILTVAGYGLAWLIAVIFAPFWPDFCDGSIVGAPCEAVEVQTMTGYLIIVLGVLTIVFGPIAGSFIDLLVNGAKWETPRGTENAITNIPLLVGIIYLVSGVVIAATA